MKIFSNMLLIKSNTKAAFSCWRQRLKIYFLAIRQNYKNSFFASTESRALLSPNFLENVNKLISLKPNIVSRTFCRKTMNGSCYCFQMIFLNNSLKCNKAKWEEKKLLKRIQCELLWTDMVLKPVWLYSPIKSSYSLFFCHLTSDTFPWGTW